MRLGRIATDILQRRTAPSISNPPHDELAVIASIFGRGEGRGLLAMIGVVSAIAGLVLIKKPFEALKCS